jgi:hypothetical protein
MNVENEEEGQDGLVPVRSFLQAWYLYLKD